jgi:hypothetical protein
MFDEFIGGGNGEPNGDRSYLDPSRIGYDPNDG